MNRISDKSKRKKRAKNGGETGTVPEKQKRGASGRSRSRGRLTGVILVFIFFAGLCVMIYPLVADYVNSRVQSKAILDYENALKNMPQEDFSAYFEAADAYNAEIRKLSFPLMYYDRVPGYEQTLDITGTGIMGYITIDKIKVDLPIYHGISAPVLNIAVGHVPGTSLPVGGIGTHCVLSAHRGLPSSTLFTHLDELEEGDNFRLTVLDRVLTYEVDRIVIVDPDEPEAIEAMYAVSGEDYCTLLTCTPYGINTHRLLVRGKRIETVQPKSKLYFGSDAYRIDPFIVTPLVAMPMLLVLLTALMVKYSKKRKKPFKVRDYVEDETGKPNLPDEARKAPRKRL